MGPQAKFRSRFELARQPPSLRIRVAADARRSSRRPQRARDVEALPLHHGGSAARAPGRLRRVVAGVEDRRDRAARRAAGGRCAAPMPARATAAAARACARPRARTAVPRSPDGRARAPPRRRSAHRAAALAAAVAKKCREMQNRLARAKLKNHFEGEPPDPAEDSRDDDGAVHRACGRRRDASAHKRGAPVPPPPPALGRAAPGKATRGPALGRAASRPPAGQRARARQQARGRSR